MAAAITYLKEWGWQAANLMRWTRPEAPLLLSNELDMQQPWWKVEKALLHEAKNQRTNRLASRQHHHNLIAGPPKANATSTLGFRQQCNFVKPPRSKDVRCAKSMPHQSTSCGYANGTKLRNMSLCRQSGWTGSHPKRKNLYGPPAGFPWNSKSIDNKTIQGHGCWADLATIAPQPYNGRANTLDATPSSYDERAQMWVFGLCVHTMTLGQLKRLGALTGVAKGEQTKARALLAGVVALAKHTSTPAKVIVQLATVWEA